MSSASLISPTPVFERATSVREPVNRLRPYSASTPPITKCRLRRSASIPSFVAERTGSTLSALPAASKAARHYNSVLRANTSPNLGLSPMRDYSILEIVELRQKCLESETPKALMLRHLSCVGRRGSGCGSLQPTNPAAFNEYFGAPVAANPKPIVATEAEENERDERRDIDMHLEEKTSSCSEACSKSLRSSCSDAETWPPHLSHMAEFVSEPARGPTSMQQNGDAQCACPSPSSSWRASALSRHSTVSDEEDAASQASSVLFPQDDAEHSKPKHYSASFSFSFSSTSSTSSTSSSQALPFLSPLRTPSFPSASPCTRAPPASGDDACSAAEQNKRNEEMDAASSMKEARLRRAASAPASAASAASQLFASAALLLRVPSIERFLRWR